MTSHKTRFRAYLTAFNTGHLDTFDSVIHADYLNHDPLHPHLSHGVDALKAVVTELRDNNPRLRFEEVALVEEGDLLAAHLLVHGVAAEPVRQIQIERFVDDQIVEHWRATGPG